LKARNDSTRDRRRKIIGRDAKDRPIYGDIANGSATGRDAGPTALIFPQRSNAIFDGRPFWPQPATGWSEQSAGVTAPPLIAPQVREVQSCAKLERLGALRTGYCYSRAKQASTSGADAP
jgi:hypothetical protein